MGVPSWLTGLLNGGGLFQGIKELIGKFKMDPAEKAEFELKLREIIERENRAVADQISAELQAKERIIIAELAQGDNYTKRMRPTIGYAGLGFIFLVHVFLPVFSYSTGKPAPELTLPIEFWLAWGGYVATYSIGRDFVKKGVGNGTANKISGVPKTLGITE